MIWEFDRWTICLRIVEMLLSMIVFDLISNGWSVVWGWIELVKFLITSGVFENQFLILVWFRIVNCWFWDLEWKAKLATWMLNLGLICEGLMLEAFAVMNDNFVLRRIDEQMDLMWNSRNFFFGINEEFGFQIRRISFGFVFSKCVNLRRGDRKWFRMFVNWKKMTEYSKGVFWKFTKTFTVQSS